MRGSTMSLPRHGKPNTGTMSQITQISGLSHPWNRLVCPGLKLVTILNRASPNSGRNSRALRHDLSESSRHRQARLRRQFARAWVDCILPLLAGTDRPEASNAVQGVTSGRSEEHGPIYKVGATDAILVLEQRNAEAARWRMEQAPTFLSLVDCSLSRPPSASYCLCEVHEP